MARLGERVLLEWDDLDEGLRLRVVESCEAHRRRWVEAQISGDWLAYWSAGTANDLLKARLSRAELEALKGPIRGPGSGRDRRIRRPDGENEEARPEGDRGPRLHLGRATG